MKNIKKKFENFSKNLTNSKSFYQKCFANFFKFIKIRVYPKICINN